MILVLDSSALIALARIGCLDLLQQLAGEVHVPAAVLEEVATPGDDRAGSAEVRRASWIRVSHVADRRVVEQLGAQLGLGESESIVLARELSADFLVLDDATARRVAEARGARVIGLLGLLVHARERGMIAALRPLLDDLKATGFYISDSLYQALLGQVGEA